MIFNSSSLYLLFNFLFILLFELLLLLLLLCADTNIYPIGNFILIPLVSLDIAKILPVYKLFEVLYPVDSMLITEPSSV